MEEYILKIGIIGLGNMGSPMGQNLANAGYEVYGFDTVASCPSGIREVSSPTELANSVDVVLTMLPDGAIVKKVASQVIPEMSSGTIFLDCSTIDVASARDVASIAETNGISPADAPVSGGVGGAVAGTLTFMVGGSELTFLKLEPLFSIMGQKAVHCGSSGNGQAAKICNNMILGATMIVTCEAFSLADKLGLDRNKMFDVVSTSSGYSWSMNAYCPAPGIGPKTPSDNNYIPGFSSDLMLKDLTLSQIAAESVDADTPMGYLAMTLYKTFVEQEDGAGKDFSAMLPRFEKKPRN